MGVDATIRDPRTGNALRLRDGELAVYSLRTPGYMLEEADVRGFGPWQGAFTSSSLSTDLNVDGSTTPQVFSIEAEDDQVILIHEIRLLFHSTNMNISGNEIRRFGPVAAPGLTNGLRMEVHRGNRTGELLVAPVQNIGDFLVNARSPSDPLLNVVDGVSAGVDILLVKLGLLAPIGLFPGSRDRVEVYVQDDLTGLALFQAFAYGEERDYGD